MAYFVPAGGFTQQVEEFAKQLTGLVDRGIEVNDDGASPTRSTSYYVEIPDAGSGVTTTFDYREEFQRVGGGWLRSRYVYELRFSEPRGEMHQRRRAHHEHGPWRINQHCQSPASPDDIHYVDVERLLQATHETFAQQFETASPVVCSGLVPLKRPTPGRP